jgi:flagellar basal-body rod protein FlgC
MGLFDAIDISGSALSAERLRMDVTAENLANANTTRGANGAAYRRKVVVLEQQAGTGGGSSFGNQLASAMSRGGAAKPAGVQVAAIAEDQTPNRRVYDPGHPDADQNGYVEMPNVDSVSEMVDLISASRAYEANVTAMQAAKSLFTKTLELLR